MKCFGSQITSIVPNPAYGRSVRDAAASFEALLVREAFAPLAKAMGFYGDTVVAAAAQAIARNERGGLTDRFERSMRVAEPSDLSLEAVSR